MKKFIIYFIALTTLLLVLLIISSKVKPLFISNISDIELLYEENISLPYPDVINAYESLDRNYREAKLLTYGSTDIGKPLQLFVISKSKIFNPEILREKGFRIVMVNNAIHPGEPCGVDASIKLARDILDHKDDLWDTMDSTILCIVPVYNIGGAHNRSPFNRANQNGPADQGFRANARNLDLNRDYAPMNSLNAQSFAKLFHHWKPNVLIDTHTTNGADYQYVMTLIPNHPQELPPMLGEFYDQSLEPYLYEAMSRTGFEMVPYVSPMGQTPESGLQQYHNSPRYTTGYGRMFNTITLMTEAHMFKPFRDRVLATYEFIKTTISFTHEHGWELKKLKDEADFFSKNKTEFTLRWELDESIVDSLKFKGFEAFNIDSKVTGGKRLKYDRNKPFTKMIPYYRHYLPSLTVSKPDCYFIPQAWHEVLHRLSINNVDMVKLNADTIIEVDAYYISNYKTYNQPYNGHYLHYDVETRTERQKIQFYEGDFLVYTNQPVNQYIIEMLEPQGNDSFFAWNFFDPILQRKEYFSPYVFEDYAYEMLNNDPILKSEFEKKKATDKNFASDSYAQLSYMYQKSPYFEKSFMRYPVYRSVATKSIE